METKLFQGFSDFLMRERVLVFGLPECGKTKLIQSLMQFQFIPPSSKRSPLIISPSDNEPGTELTISYRRFRRPTESRGRVSHEMRMAYLHANGMISQNPLPTTSLKQSKLKRSINSDQYFFISQYGEANIVMRIWDISMEHLFVFLNPQYRRSQLLLLVYDSSDIDQLRYIRSPLQLYLESLTEEQRSNQTIFVVATKIDQSVQEDGSSAISRLSNETQSWFFANDIKHFFVSVSLNKGIDVLRACIFQCIYQKHCAKNLWIHRSLIVERYKAKYRSCHHSIHEEEDFNGAKIDWLHCCLKSSSCSLHRTDDNYQSYSFEALENLKMLIQNICQCLDNLSSTIDDIHPTPPTKSCRSKKYGKIYEY